VSMRLRIKLCRRLYTGYSPIRNSNLREPAICNTKCVSNSLPLSLRPHSLFTDIFTNFTTLPIQDLTKPFPALLRNQTLELASNNLICSVALTGVLALQAGRLWAEKEGALDNDDDYVLIDPKDVTSTDSSASPAKPEKLQHDVKLPIRVETN
jgi:ER membrane protein SH3